MLIVLRRFFSFAFLLSLHLLVLPLDSFVVVFRVIASVAIFLTLHVLGLFVEYVCHTEGEQVVVLVENAERVAVDIVIFPCPYGV